MIWIKDPGAKNIGEWVRLIAHESTHAFNSFRAPKRRGASIAARVREAIDDEIKTRKQVIKILQQIKKTRLGRRLLNGYTATICADRSIVERNFFPSGHKSTYLEFFMFSVLIDEAGKKLISSQHIDKAIDAVPLVMSQSKINWGQVQIKCYEALHPINN